MNRLIFQAEQRRDSTVVATSRQSAHIQEILKLSEGDTLRVGQWGGNLGEARLMGWEGKKACLEILSLESPPPPKLPLTLLLAMPRPKMFRRLLQSITSLGVERLILINSWRVEKSYWQTPWLTTEAMQENILAGLEQAGDSVPLEVIIRKRFKPFVEDELPMLRQRATHAWVAHPSPDPTRALERAGENTCTLLAIGPEGGFIPYEVEKLINAGFSPLSLGERILRVDTAVPTLVGKLFL